MADAYAVHACVRNNYDRLRPWFYWITPTITLEDIRAYIAEVTAQTEPRRRFEYGFWKRERFGGSIGLHVVDWQNRIARIGYWLDADFEKKGLVTQAARALIDVAFLDLHLNRIEIRCAPNNAVSRAVPQRLGFLEEGTHRQALALHGGFQDLVMYAMLARDWPEHRNE